MHRGSSKGGADPTAPPETLPLSASPEEVDIEIVFGRAAERRTDRRRVRSGARVRDVLRSVGQAPEGSVVLIDSVSVPLDLPITRSLRLVVIPTFSGG